MNDDLPEVEGRALMASRPILSGVRILIVEDSEMMQMHYDQKLAVLRQAFPDSDITRVSRLDEAIAMVDRAPAPDLVILDLHLEDSEWENTLDHLPRFEARSSVLIVSAHSEEEIRSRITSKTVKIVHKGPDMWKGNFFVNLALELICFRRRISLEEAWAKLNRVKERSGDGHPQGA